MIIFFKSVCHSNSAIISFSSAQAWILKYSAVIRKNTILVVFFFFLYCHTLKVKVKELGNQYCTFRRQTIFFDNQDIVACRQGMHVQNIAQLHPIILSTKHY